MKFNMSTNEESVGGIIKTKVKRKRELVELLFIDVKEGFIQKVDLGYTLVSPIIKIRLHISLSYN